MRLRRILSICLCLVMVFTCLPSMLFNISEETVYAATDAMTAIESALDSSYKKDKTTLTDDGYIGIPAEITIYYDSATHGNITPKYDVTQLIVYVVNTPTPRVGVKDDVTIIKDMLSKGYIVAVLDYMNNAKAVSPGLDFSAQYLHSKIRKGEYFTNSCFGSGTYMHSYVVPAGHNIMADQVFWSLDKHGAEGSLEKIVETWNNDFRGVKGNSMVYWLDSSGKQKKTSTAFDGTSPVWYNASGAQVSSTASDAKYTKVKWTVAETIFDCVNPDGSALDMDLTMSLIYPTVNSTSTYKAPVMTLQTASGFVNSSASPEGEAHVESMRPHLFGFGFDGYATAVYEYLWVPMAQDCSFGYFDGKTSATAITGDQITYSIHTYNDKEINTAAMRYIRYLGRTNSNLKITDEIGVFGYSKGGWHAILGLEELRNLETIDDYDSTDALNRAIQAKIQALPNKRVFPGHHGESRWEAGNTTANGYIRGGEMQPWLSYNGEEIFSGADVLYPGCGASEEDIHKNHAPIFISQPLSDEYNSAYGAGLTFANICRTLDIPAMYFQVENEHEMIRGNDIIYNVDGYMAWRKFAGYVLKDDPVSVAFTDPLNNDADIATTKGITIKFYGPVPETEITKVTVTGPDGVAVTGNWTSLYGKNEWIFTPDVLKGNTTYTITVPAGIKGDNGVAATETYTSSFTTKGEVNYTASASAQGTAGTYFQVTVPDTSSVTKFVPNQFMARFKVENDAANVAEIYPVTSFDAGDPDASTVGDLIGKVNLKGAGYYDVDITSYIKTLNTGDTATFLIKAQKESGEVTVYNHDFVSDLGDIEADNGRYDTKIWDEDSYQFVAAPDGTNALQVKVMTNAGTYVNNEFYQTISVFNNNVLIKTSNINMDDYGRKFRITMPVYDTTKRYAQLTMNSCTSMTDGTIDYDKPHANYITQPGQWQDLVYDYTAYETSYGTIGQQRKTLTFKLSQGNDTSNNECPIYIKGINVTEIITDIDVAAASTSLVCTTFDNIEDKEPESDVPFAIYDASDNKLAEYATYKAALSAYKYGQTIKLQKDYTLVNNDRYADFATNTNAVGSDGNNEFVIDLNGYKLDSQNTSGGLIWAKATSASIPKTTITLKNGCVYLYKTALVSYDESTTAGNGKAFDINIENVNFYTKPNTMEKTLMSDATTPNSAKITSDISYTDCTFTVPDDLIPENPVTIFPKATGNLTLTHTVYGSQVNIDSFRKVRIYGAANKVTFAKNSLGDYLYVKLPTAVLVDDDPYNMGGTYGTLEYATKDSTHTTYTLVESELATPYGIVPEKWADVTAYPLVTFDPSGNCTTATNDIATDNDATTSLDSSRKWGSGSVTYLRRDYTYSDKSQYNNLSFMYGDHTIDLGGHTLTCSSTSAQFFMSYAKVNSTATHIIVKNGTFVTYKPIINFQAGSVTKTMSYTFENVTLKMASGSTYTDILCTATKSGTATSVLTGNITLTDCKIDMTGMNLTANKHIISLYNSSGYVKGNAVINGGEIVLDANSAQYIQLSELETNSTIKFGEGSDGKYVKVTVPTSSASSSTIISGTYTTVNSQPATFSSSTVSGSNTIYQMTSDVVTTMYGVIPNAYKSATDYPWAVFDGKGNFLLATDDFGTDNDSTSALEAMRLSGSGAVVLLRRDLTYTQTNSYWNTSLMYGNYTLDLGNHTITCRNDSQFLFCPQGKGTGEDTNFTIKNGKIYSSRPVIRYEANTKAKNTNFTFNNVTLGAAVGAAYNELIIHTHNNTAATAESGGTVTFNNCKFEMKGLGLTAQKRFFNLNDSNGMLNINVIVNGGTFEMDANGLQYTTFFELEDGSTVKFGKYGGDYMKLTVPTGSTSTTITSSYTATDSTALSFLEYSTDSSAATTTYELGTLTTPYGTIPSDYASVEDYPFVTFDADGNFLNAAPIFAADSGSTNSAIVNVAKQTEGEWVIYLRRDYTYSESKFNNLSFIYGTLTFDMNGKTITCTQSGDAGMFAAQSKRDVDSNIIIKNGEFKVTKHPVVSYAIYGTDKGVKDFNFTFDNVKFGFNTGATTTSLVANYLGTSGTASYLDKFGGTVKFNNCTFDAKTNAPSGTIKLFSAGDADNYLVNAYEITGGSITASSGDALTIFEVNNSDSSVYFKKNSSGNYIKLTLPSGAAAPSAKLIADTEDGEATFTPTSSTVYTLVPSIETVYGMLPARYESAEDYPLAVFDKNGTFETATADFGTDSDATSALTSAKGDGDVILLRRNYFYNPSQIYNNLSQIVGTTTLDLNGFTIRCDSSSWPLFKAQSKTAYDSTLKIKNGTILAGAKPLILFSSWSNSVYDGSSGKKFAFQFDNVNLGLISAATTDSLIGLYNDIFNFACDFPVTFNNCTFDLRNATTKVKLFEAGVSSTTNCKSAFTVNGGKIIASDLDYVDFYNAANSVSSVTFGKGSNGAYTLLELPESVTEAPTDTFPTSEGNLSYSPTATAGLFMLRSSTSSIWDIATPVNITANGKATFKGMYYGTTPTSLCLIAAAYEGDKLTKVDFMEATSVTANTLVDLTATVTPTEDETVRYFLWDGMSTMKPYIFE